MIAINGQTGAEYVLDLNETHEDEYVLTVSSVNENGCGVNWYTDISGTDFMEVEPSGTDSFIARFDNDAIEEEMYFRVRNTDGESVKIVVLPDKERPSAFNYTFTSPEQSVSGNVIAFKIKSTANRRKQGWRLDYDGRPIKYEFSKTEGTGTETIKIECLSKVGGMCTSMIRFRQNASELCLKLFVRHDDDIMTIEDVVEGC